jgi:hypothetical protein
MKTLPHELPLWLVAPAVVIVIYVAYRIGKVILRVFLGFAVLALLSFWIWSLFHP